MHVTAFADAAAFLAASGPALYEDEVRHHLVLGVAEARARDAAPDVAHVVLAEDDLPVLAAIVAPRHPAIIAVTGDRAAAAIDALAGWMRDQSLAPRGFIADVGHAEAFAAAWERRGGQATLRMRQRLHALRDMADVAQSPGRLRPAALDDLDLLTGWMRAFNTEALGETLDPELRDTLTRRLERGEMFVWEDTEPRAMAAFARPTKGGVAVNSVYTPIEWRGRGYATTIVAALTRRLLDAGKHFCVLYTDLANPTSNAIYARIGYRPVSDSLVYAL